MFVIDYFVEGIMKEAIIQDLLSQLNVAGIVIFLGEIVHHDVRYSNQTISEKIKL